MSSHVAILLKPYIRLILGGKKTIESRLTRNPIPPYRRIQAGDRIYFKASSGPFLATALADRIEFHDRLTPATIDALRRRLNAQVCGAPEFWTWKRQSRYATFVWLKDVRPIDQGPPFAPSQGIAWFVLADGPDQSRAVSARIGAALRGRPGSASTTGRVPLVGRGSGRRTSASLSAFTITLTAGALRNHYLRLAGLPCGPIMLHLPDGKAIPTELTPRHMIRWRGWGKYYQQHGLRAGDVVRFVPDGPQGYRVHFVTQSHEN